MSVSQFNLYSSGDVGAPVLNGTSGSLLALLDACLVTGYGAKGGSGWTKPFENTSSYGIIKQPTGSMMTLWIRDDAPNNNAAAGAREARIQGWEIVTSIEGGWPTGSGQFPTFAQTAIPSGSLCMRKTATVDSTPRSWIMYADSHSFYTFIESESDGVYYGYTFGDIYSLKTGSVDDYRCAIIARSAEASATSAYEHIDRQTQVNTVLSGHYMARSYTGLGGSVTVGKHADSGKATNFAGLTQAPNGVDGGYYIAPVWVHENASSTIRGRMRGFWLLCHPAASFSLGQIISGSGAFAGKNFQVIKTTKFASGCFLMETSNTIDTN